MRTFLQVAAVILITLVGGTYVQRKLHATPEVAQEDAVCNCTTGGSCICNGSCQCTKQVTAEMEMTNALSALTRQLAESQAATDARLASIETSVASQITATQTAIDARIAEVQSATDVRIDELTTNLELQMAASSEDDSDERFAALEARLDMIEIADDLPMFSEPMIPEPVEPARVYIEPPITGAPTTNDENGYLTRAAIKDWIHDHYRTGDYSFNHATVTPSAAWDHLMDGSDGTHVWKDWQIEDLTNWEAQALHDATHGRLIHPRTQLSPPAYQIPSTSTAGVPIFWRNGRWEWEYHGKKLYADQLWEGYETPSGTYRYKDGRMLVYELVTEEAEPIRIASASSARTTSAPRVTYQSYGGCANGQCSNGRRLFGGWGRRNRR